MAKYPLFITKMLASIGKRHALTGINPAANAAAFHELVPVVFFSEHYDAEYDKQYQALCDNEHSLATYQAIVDKNNIDNNPHKLWSIEVLSTRNGVVRPTPINVLREGQPAGYESYVVAIIVHEVEPGNFEYVVAVHNICPDNRARDFTTIATVWRYTRPDLSDGTKMMPIQNADVYGSKAISYLVSIATQAHSAAIGAITRPGLEYGTAPTPIVRPPGAKKNRFTIQDTMYIRPRRPAAKRPDATLRPVKWSYSWPCRAHWRTLPAGQIGHDRFGNVTADGRTYVKESRRGDLSKPVRIKTRVA